MSFAPPQSVAARPHRDKPICGRTGRPRISVVIPTLNEEQCIARTLERAALCDAGEIIVADGGSTDATRTIAEQHGATVVLSPPGRGCQLNAGARAATGDVLLFLHADTSLPYNYEQHVFDALEDPAIAAGAFRLVIDAPGPSFRLLEKLVAFRSRRLHLPYGDQALFTRADLFRRLGGFPEIPAMEDFAFVRKLRRAGHIALADVAVVTSARRWLAHGAWRTTMRNQACVAAYLLGVSPARIAHWRHPAGP